MEPFHACKQGALTKILNAVKLFGQVDVGSADNTTLPIELALVENYLAYSQAPPAGTPETAAPVIPARKAAETAKATATKAETVQKPATPVSEATEKAAAPVKIEAPVKAEQVEKAPAAPAAKTTPPEMQVVKETPAAAPGLTSDIERLRLNWKQMIENMPAHLKKTKAAAMMRSAGPRPVTVENDTVVLAIKKGIFLDNMEKPEYQQVVEQIISEFLGRPCKVRYIAEETNISHLVKAAQKNGGTITSVEEK